MASRILVSRTPLKNLNHLLQPPLHNSSQFLRTLSSLVSRDFIPRNRQPGYSRTNATLGLDTRVPATIITGFLGSGKTTLLNHILTSQHGKRIAVIENEFGEVDIDGSLVASHSSSNENIVMVNNGCLCCTVRGDLVKMILQLVKEKRDKFDHIVIETTGLAKPSPVIETFCMDELVSRHVKLDGVVTLVDCKHAMQHLNEVKPRFVVNEAVEQVAYADCIILNKIDLVTKTELETLTKTIKHMNGMAQIKLAKFGSVDMDLFWVWEDMILKGLIMKFKLIVPVLPHIIMKLEMNMSSIITTMYAILLSQVSVSLLREHLILMRERTQRWMAAWLPGRYMGT